MIVNEIMVFKPWKAVWKTFGIFIFCHKIDIFFYYIRKTSGWRCVRRKPYKFYK